MERKIGRNEIAVFILNSDQELLLQKRSANKKHYPNCWALCTGHVEPGESLSDAALREMKAVSYTHLTLPTKLEV